MQCTRKVGRGGTAGTQGLARGLGRHRAGTRAGLAIGLVQGWAGSTSLAGTGAELAVLAVLARLAQGWHRG